VSKKSRRKKRQNKTHTSTLNNPCFAIWHKRFCLYACTDIDWNLPKDNNLVAFNKRSEAQRYLSHFPDPDAEIVELHHNLTNTHPHDGFKVGF
jgi:hypothetical protein